MDDLPYLNEALRNSIADIAYRKGNSFWISSHLNVMGEHETDLYPLRFAKYDGGCSYFILPTPSTIDPVLEFFDEKHNCSLSIVFKKGASGIPIALLEIAHEDAIRIQFPHTGKIVSLKKIHMFLSRERYNELKNNPDITEETVPVYEESFRVIKENWKVFHVISRFDGDGGKFDEKARAKSEGKVIFEDGKCYGLIGDPLFSLFPHAQSGTKFVVLAEKKNIALTRMLTIKLPSGKSAEYTKLDDFTSAGIDAIDEFDDVDTIEEL